MNRFSAFRLITVFIFLAVCGSVVAASATDPPSVTIWNQLVDLGANKKGVDAAKLLGPEIQVAGFITANEFNDGEISEFLLARYPGGCVHVPLPPPSSLIHVTMASGKTTPIFFGKRVVIVGNLQKGGRIDASLEMTATSVKELPW
jgi:hypothetical protein